jgi:hypothetical protein
MRRVMHEEQGVLKIVAPQCKVDGRLFQEQMLLWARHLTQSVVVYIF